MILNLILRSALRRGGGTFWSSSGKRYAWRRSPTSSQLFYSIVVTRGDVWIDNGRGNADNKRSDDKLITENRAHFQKHINIHNNKILIITYVYTSLFQFAKLQQWRILMSVFSSLLTNDLQTNIVEMNLPPL